MYNNQNLLNFDVKTHEWSKESEILGSQKLIQKIHHEKSIKNRQEFYKAQNGKPIAKALKFQAKTPSSVS